MSYEAKIIADSICNGHRLTTMQVTHPIAIHQDFMTHGMFARNASSSRAIPFRIMVKKVMEDPYIPARFGKNQKGMQAGIDLSDMEHEEAVQNWLAARDACVQEATDMYNPDGLDVHKQYVNRLLAPWSWITCCVTGTWPAWSNYFALRCHPAADPGIQTQANMAQLIYFRSQPRELLSGQWHLPYLNEEEKARLSWDIRTRSAEYSRATAVSAARCTRTSYLTQEGKRDEDEDLAMHDRILASRPLHASGLEHTAMAMDDNERYSKYVGWKSYRHFQPNEMTYDFVPNLPELVEELALGMLCLKDVKNINQYPWGRV